MSSKWKRSSQELVDHFHESMIGFEGIDRKKMFGYPCCFCNGNMFTGLHEENWVLRLPHDLREQLINEYHAQQFQPMPNRTMKEYIIIPEKILSCQKTLLSLIEKSIEYVQTLPIK
ncbi:MAG: TfoX/Sxy family protein [Chlamydiales bacterium]|nr:TfoX/Sxy family protein [Chlamydiales bacterium]